MSITTDTRPPAHIQADLEETISNYEAMLVQWHTSCVHMDASDPRRQQGWRNLQVARRSLRLKFNDR